METKPIRKTPGAISTAYLKALQEAETVANAVKQAAYTSRLAKSAITTAAADALLARVETCRADFTAAVELRERKKSLTAVELAEEKVLTRFVRQAQSAARQKGADVPDPEHYRANYYLGEQIVVNRSNLAAYSEGILQRLATDDLPGCDADFIAAFSATRGRWQQANAAQSEAQAQAGEKHQTAKDVLEEIQQGRRRIQRAAEFQFPASDSNNATARAAFLLPATRPFRG
ncbi:hypothetical protein [Armatimonas sp.]|uniref:hypothetical protein n=1 Tax=Armatimonas sp. TaxID=1872638 RepID=UPI0037504164